MLKLIFLYCDCGLFYIQLVEHCYHYHSFVPSINNLCLRHLLILLAISECV